MATMIMVKAKDAGIVVPREDNSRRYIGDEVVEVPRSSYYIRRLRDGELVELTGADADKARDAIAKKRSDEKAAEDKAIADATKSAAAPSAASSRTTSATKGKE